VDRGPAKRHAPTSVLIFRSETLAFVSLERRASWPIFVTSLERGLELNGRMGSMSAIKSG
jgi:hypothetical protein